MSPAHRACPGNENVRCGLRRFMKNGTTLLLVLETTGTPWKKRNRTDGTEPLSQRFDECTTGNHPTVVDQTSEAMIDISMIDLTPRRLAAIIAYFRDTLSTEYAYLSCTSPLASVMAVAFQLASCRAYNLSSCVPSPVVSRSLRMRFATRIVKELQLCVVPESIPTLHKPSVAARVIAYLDCSSNARISSF